MRNFSYWIELGLRSFYSRIIDNTSITNEAFSIYRIFFGLFLLFFYPKYSWIGDMPKSFFKPHVLTVANLFETFPDCNYFHLIDIVVMGLIILATIGVKTRLVFLLLFLITAVNSSFYYSFGKIDHNFILIQFLLLLFSFSNGGAKYALLPDKVTNYQNFALAVFSICTVFAFFTAGYEKAFYWVDFNTATSGVNAWFYPIYLDFQERKLLADLFLYIPAWAVEIMDYSVVMFEITGILFLYHSRKSWYIYLISASVFHLANTLVLGIDYINHFVVFGLWLIGPILIKYKWLVGILFLCLFLENLDLAIALWTSILVIASRTWFISFIKRVVIQAE